MHHPFTTYTRQESLLPYIGIVVVFATLIAMAAFLPGRADAAERTWADRSVMTAEETARALLWLDRLEALVPDDQTLTVRGDQVIACQESAFVCQAAEIHDATYESIFKATSGLVDATPQQVASALLTPVGPRHIVVVGPRTYARADATAYANAVNNLEAIYGDVGKAWVLREADRNGRVTYRAVVRPYDTAATTASAIDLRLGTTSRTIVF